VDRARLNVVARRVLLDAITALREQRDAVIVVGAQAVYLRSEDDDLTGSAFTSDADLGIDPRALKQLPLIEQAIQEAGFRRHEDARAQPGQWWRIEQVDGNAVRIEVDLLVPESFSVPGSRRSAVIPPHAKGATRKVPGLEPTVVDNDCLAIRSLEPELDRRTITVKVAGAASLLVAKTYKINDRLDQRSGRLSDKDAGDVIRLMQTSDAHTVADVFARLVRDPAVGEVSQRGLDLLGSQFGTPRSPGVEMAVRAMAGVTPERTIRALAPAYVRVLT